MRGRWTYASGVVKHVCAEMTIRIARRSRTHLVSALTLLALRALAALAILALPMLATLARLALPARAQEAPRSPTPTAVKIPARIVEVARDLEHPWGLAFLPDGRMLVTERPGRLRIVDRGGRCRRRWPACPRCRPAARAGFLTSRSARTSK